MSELLNRITVDPNICNGKPTFRNTRITVQTVLDFLAAGDDKSELLTAYPDLTENDVRAALEFASKLLENNYVIKSV